MKHLFITTLSEPVESWNKAFPGLQCVDRVDAISAYANESQLMFWVHAQIEQPEQWLSDVQALVNLFPQHKVAVLANVPEQNELLQALALGAVAYIHAYSHPNFLAEVFNAVRHGGVWLGKDLLKQLITATVQKAAAGQQHVEEVTEALTHREREVAIEAAKGYSNKEIARTLGISERTVKAHLTSVFETLNVKDRLHLALIMNGQSPEPVVPSQAAIYGGKNRLRS